MKIDWLKWHWKHQYTIPLKTIPILRRRFVIARPVANKWQICKIRFNVQGLSVKSLSPRFKRFDPRSIICVNGFEVFCE